MRPYGTCLFDKAWEIGSSTQLLIWLLGCKRRGRSSYTSAPLTYRLGLEVQLKPGGVEDGRPSSNQTRHHKQVGPEANEDDQQLSLPGPFGGASTQRFQLFLEGYDEYTNTHTRTRDGHTED